MTRLDHESGRWFCSATRVHLNMVDQQETTRIARGDSNFNSLRFDGHRITAPDSPVLSSGVAAMGRSAIRKCRHYIRSRHHSRSSPEGPALCRRRGIKATLDLRCMRRLKRKEHQGGVMEPRSICHPKSSSSEVDWYQGSGQRSLFD